MRRALHRRFSRILWWIEHAPTEHLEDVAIGVGAGLALAILYAFGGR